MSDLLIRGMELPSEINPDSYIELGYGIDGKSYARLYNFHFGGLTEWCEIIPVPPHGRLGDLDALIALLERQIKNHEIIAKRQDEKGTGYTKDMNI